MSGLSKERNKFVRIMKVVSIIYFIVSIVIIVFLVKLPDIYNMKMEDNTKLIQKNIKDKLASTTTENEYVDFSNLVNDNDIQLIVNRGDSNLYSSSSIIDYEELIQNNQKSNIYYSSNYQVNSEGTIYDIGLIVYNTSQNQVISQVVIVFLIVFTIIMILILLLVYLFSQTLIRPLKGLENNIRKLNEYKFDDVVNKEEKISLFTQELEEFANSIKARSEDFELAYTSLEKELLSKEETTTYKAQVVSSLVHDLKTPLSLIRLNANTLEKNIEELRHRERLFEINTNVNEVFLNVNDILEINNSEIEIKEESIDLAKLLKQNLVSFDKLFQEKNILINLDVLPQAKINVVKFELVSIINNSLSNIYKYSKRNSIVDIILEEKDKYYSLTFRNEADNIESIDFDNAFNLFYVDNHSNDNSGMGLFLIKRFVEKNNGHYSFQAVGNTIVLSVEFLKNEGDKDE